MPRLQAAGRAFLGQARGDWAQGAAGAQEGVQPHIACAFRAEHTDPPPGVWSGLTTWVHAAVFCMDELCEGHGAWGMGHGAWGLLALG